MKPRDAADAAGALLAGVLIAMLFGFLAGGWRACTAAGPPPHHQVGDP